MKITIGLFLLLVGGNANATSVWNGSWSGPATLGIPTKHCHFNTFTLTVAATDSELTISNASSNCLNDDGTVFTTWPNNPETFQITAGKLYSNGIEAGSVSETQINLLMVPNVQPAQTYNLNSGVLTIHRVFLGPYAIDGVLNPTSP